MDKDLFEKSDLPEYLKKYSLPPESSQFKKKACEEGIGATKNPNQTSSNESNLLAKFGKCEKELVKKQARIDDLETQCRKVQNERDDLQQQLVKFAATKETVARLSADITDLEEKKSSLCDETDRLSDKIQKQRLETQRLNEQLAEKEITLSALYSCQDATCEHRAQVVQQMGRANAAHIETMLHRDNFHFFLTYYEEYGNAVSGGVVGSHMKIIAEKGFCWWGKFFEELIDNQPSRYKCLEPYNESIPVDENHRQQLNALKANVLGRIARGLPVYLYLYNPNPPEPTLHVGSICDFHFRYDDWHFLDPESSKPACAYAAEYALADLEEKKRLGNCEKCKDRQSGFCRQKFRCNYWFKLKRPINDFRETPERSLPLQKYLGADLQRELFNLRNCITNRHVDFSVPIMYPLFVYNHHERRHFDPRPLKQAGCEIHLARKESGHSRFRTLESYFKSLFEACPYFKKVIGNSPYPKSRFQHDISEGQVLDFPNDPERLVIVLPRKWRKNEDVCPAFTIFLDEDDLTPHKSEYIKHRLLEALRG